jgi:hypothetical protein
VGIEIRDEGPEALAAYASISISFPVVEVLDADALSVASPRPFAARPVAVPEVKDYDAHPGMTRSTGRAGLISPAGDSSWRASMDSTSAVPL